MMSAIRFFRIPWYWLFRKRYQRCFFWKMKHNFSWNKKQSKWMLPALLLFLKFKFYNPNLVVDRSQSPVLFRRSERYLRWRLSNFISSFARSRPRKNNRSPDRTTTGPGKLWPDYHGRDGQQQLPCSQRRRVPTNSLQLGHPRGESPILENATDCGFRCQKGRIDWRVWCLFRRMRQDRGTHSGIFV